jgi:ribosomal protein S18 acetylase RimI-like enzyme
VRPLTAQDHGLLPAVRDVFAEGLGAGYVTAGELDALVAGDRPEAAVFAALVGGEVAGAATTDRAPADLVSRLPRLGGHRVGQLRSMAVGRRFRRRGLGTALTAARIAHLRGAGCTAVVSLSWLSGDPDNSQGVLRAHGLEPVAELPDHWRDVPVPCPRCGLPCHCTAAAYVRLW